MVRTSLARLLTLTLAAGLLAGATPLPDQAPPERACVRKRFEGSTFTVCGFQPGRDKLRLVLNAADGRPIRRLPVLGGCRNSRIGAFASR